MVPGNEALTGDLLFRLWIPRNGVPWLTANTVKGRHWRVVHAIRTDWKQSTLVAAALAKLGRGYPPAVLDSIFYFKQHRTRDPLNFADTLKPIVDFLISERNCWPDDNPTFLTQLAPQLSVEPDMDGVELFAYERLDPE